MSRRSAALLTILFLLGVTASSEAKPRDPAHAITSQLICPCSCGEVLSGCTCETGKTMQGYVENAIKHNEFSDKLPLTINVSILSNYVIVRNIINPRHYAAPTSKIGLGNLDNRYKLITKRNIIIENNFKTFTVKLPIIKF